MTAVLSTDDRRTDGIQLEFDQARADVIDARLDERRKDTPAARARVAGALARLDAVLDRWNDGPRVCL
jgi:hypothetical protein